MSSNRRRRLVPLLLNSTTLWRAVQRVLQRAVGELFVVPVQRITEGPILDAIAHVVHIHPEGVRFGGGYRDTRGEEANVGLANVPFSGICGTSPRRSAYSSE